MEKLKKNRETTTRKKIAWINRNEWLDNSDIRFFFSFFYIYFFFFNFLLSFMKADKFNQNHVNGHREYRKKNKINKICVMKFAIFVSLKWQDKTNTKSTFLKFPINVKQMWESQDNAKQINFGIEIFSIFFDFFIFSVSSLPVRIPFKCSFEFSRRNLVVYSFGLFLFFSLNSHYQTLFYIFFFDFTTR